MIVEQVWRPAPGLTWGPQEMFNVAQWGSQPSDLLQWLLTPPVGSSHMWSQESSYGIPWWLDFWPKNPAKLKQKKRASMEDTKGKLGRMGGLPLPPEPPQTNKNKKQVRPLNQTQISIGYLLYIW